MYVDNVQMFFMITGGLFWMYFLVKTGYVIFMKLLLKRKRSKTNYLEHIM